jgi:Transposase, Mutator family
MADDTPSPLNNVITIDDERIKNHLDRVVRGSVEETLNALLDAEADRLCNAQRYERSEARRDTRAGHSKTSPCMASQIRSPARSWQPGSPRSCRRMPRRSNAVCASSARHGSSATKCPPSSIWWWRSTTVRVSRKRAPGHRHSGACSRMPHHRWCQHKFITAMPAGRKIALVSGGSRGLGAALITGFLARRYAVATLSRTKTAFISDTMRRRRQFLWSCVDGRDPEALLVFVKEVGRPTVGG